MFDSRRGPTRTEFETFGDKANEKVARHRADAELDLPRRPGPLSRLRAWLATVTRRRFGRRGGPDTRG